MFKFPESIASSKLSRAIKLQVVALIWSPSIVLLASLSFYGCVKNGKSQATSHDENVCPLDMIPYDCVRMIFDEVPLSIAINKLSGQNQLLGPIVKDRITKYWPDHVKKRLGLDTKSPDYSGVIAYYRVLMSLHKYAKSTESHGILKGLAVAEGVHWFHYVGENLVSVRFRGTDEVKVLNLKTNEMSTVQTSEVGSAEQALGLGFGKLAIKNWFQNDRVYIYDVSNQKNITSDVVMIPENSKLKGSQALVSLKNGQLLTMMSDNNLQIWDVSGSPKQVRVIDNHEHLPRLPSHGTSPSEIYATTFAGFMQRLGLDVNDPFRTELQIDEKNKIVSIADREFYYATNSGKKMQIFSPGRPSYITKNGDLVWMSESTEQVFKMNLWDTVDSVLRQAGQCK